eukprot:6177322-Amphidinium_carterae.1
MYAWYEKCCIVRMHDIAGNTHTICLVNRRYTVDTLGAGWKSRNSRASIVELFKFKLDTG